MLRAVGVAAAGETASEYVVVFVCFDELESEAATANVEVPLTVGVPDRTPELESVSPDGSVPDVSVHEYGPFPPCALNATLYALPTCPFGSWVVVIASDVVVCVEFETVSGTWFDAAPSEFRTCNCATAGCASAVPLTFAANVVEFTTVVGTAVPFTIKVACDWKFAPCTVRVTSDVPAGITCGEIWLIVGLIIAITVTPDPHPEHKRLTTNPNAASLAQNFVLIKTPRQPDHLPERGGIKVDSCSVGPVHRT